MDSNKIKDAHNSCVGILNNSELSNKELVATLAQLLIYSGQAITEKEIDIYKMNIDELNKEYYGNNKENDLGLGLILNGSSIMSTVSREINSDNLSN